MAPPLGLDNYSGTARPLASTASPVPPSLLLPSDGVENITLSTDSGQDSVYRVGPSSTLSPGPLPSSAVAGPPKDSLPEPIASSTVDRVPSCSTASYLGCAGLGGEVAGAGSGRVSLPGVRDPMTCDLASVADDPLSVPLCHGALALVQNPFPVDLEPRGLVLPPSSGTDRVSLKVESQELAEELQCDEIKLRGGSTPLVADACLLQAAPSEWGLSEEHETLNGQYDPQGGSSLFNVVADGLLSSAAFVASICASAKGSSQPALASTAPSLSIEEPASDVKRLMTQLLALSQPCAEGSKEAIELSAEGGEGGHRARVHS